MVSSIMDASDNGDGEDVSPGYVISNTFVLVCVKGIVVGSIGNHGRPYASVVVK